MILDELRAAVQPLIDDDFDEAYARFRSGTGSDDVGLFLLHLKERRLLSDEELSVIYEVYPELSGAGTLAQTRRSPSGATPIHPGTRSRGAPKPPPPSRAPGQSASASDAPATTTAEPDRSPDATAEGPTSTWSDPSAPAPLPSGLKRAGKRTGPGTDPSAASSKPRPRRTTPLTGRGYTIIGTVGEGAMGKVYLARDLDLARTVAYKEMSPEIADKPALAGKFYAEAQITAQLDHPNIVPIYALDEGPDGTLAYSMKLIRGKTLEQLIVECMEAYDKGARRLDDEHDLTTRLEHFLKVCDAMHYAHSRGVVHRDLKPENVMIGPYGEVYVMDWGIAKVLDKPKDAKVTGWVELDEEPPEEGDVVIGTPQYMSPEQALGNTASIGPASDQYALGLILFELVSLNHAVTGKTPMAIVLRQQEAQKDRLVHYKGKRIPTELRAIIDKATQRAPADRYPDVHELAEDVRRYLRGEAVLAKPDTALQATLRWVGRHRGFTLFSIVALGALFVVVTLGSQVWYQYQRIQDQYRQERLSEILSAVGTQGALVDGQFVRYEGLLGVIAASATEMVGRRATEDVPVYFQSDFLAVKEDPDRHPELAAALDLRESKRYGIPVSIAHPVFVAAPDLPLAEAVPRAQRLEPLNRYLRNVLLRSSSEDAVSYPRRRAERLLLDIGVPIAWVHVGLADGLYVGFPGHGETTGRFDPRERPWYTLATGEDNEKLARGVRGPQWGSPYVDPSGLGRLLPSSMAMLDEDDNLLGVASVELTFDYVIDELMEIPELAGRAEAYLLDEQGRIVVRSSQKGAQARSALGARAVRLPTYPSDEVVEAITVRGKRSGYLETSVAGEDKLVVWQRMHSLGWFYLVDGDPDELLE